MSFLTVLSNKEISSSRFIHMRKVNFLQNGKDRTWDYVKSMDAVSALVFDKVNKEFICIRQFRPPLYFGASELSKETIPKEHLGFCYELCAGLLDREGRSKEQAICDEIREELGYDVSINSLEFITRTVGNVGMSGARGYMYYTEVTPEQKKYEGGGLESEGEQIETVRIKENEIDSFLMDQSIEKSAGLFIGFYWWKHIRHSTNCICMFKNKQEIKKCIVQQL